MIATLREYRRKRHFERTPEPAGKARARPRQRAKKLRFVIQKHAATSLHYDFRLEADGVLKSWAVPKGPSANPKDKRLAMRTEDHPIDYLKFEGVIPQGEYGAGPVIVWDLGTYRNITEDSQGREVSVGKALDNGKLEVWLEGEKVKGGYVLVRTRGSANRSAQPQREQWLLIKKNDEAADPRKNLVEEFPQSVLSKRTLEELGSARAKRTTARSNSRVATRPRGRVASRLEAFPSWTPPMLATLAEPESFFVSRQVREAPQQWVVERKLDGFRALAFRRGNEVRLLSRNHNDLGGKFPEIVEALRAQRLQEFVIDGEVVGVSGRRMSFENLQQRMTPISLAQTRRRGGVRLIYYVFDLLHALGHDARQLPLEERKRLLKQAISFELPLRFSAHTKLRGHKSLDEACRKGWEGLIAKRADRQYIGKRSTDWIKLKCVNRQEFVVGGFTDPQGSRTGFGALLIGYYADGKLRFAGRVGTGYNQKILTSLHKTLIKLTVARSPFAPDAALPKRNVHWVQPKLVAEIGFTEWTSDGKLRHPRFVGLRTDKAADQITREIPRRF